MQKVSSNKAGYWLLLWQGQNVKRKSQVTIKCRLEYRSLSPDNYYNLK